MTTYRFLEALTLSTILKEAPVRDGKLIFCGEKYDYNKLKDRFQEFIKDYLKEYKCN